MKRTPDTKSSNHETRLHTYNASTYYGPRPSCCDKPDEHVLLYTRYINGVTPRPRRRMVSRISVGGRERGFKKKHHSGMNTADRPYTFNGDAPAHRSLLRSLRRRTRLHGYSRNPAEVNATEYFNTVQYQGRAPASKNVLNERSHTTQTQNSSTHDVCA